jgi:predicted HicB family RNase H-like nuclease
MKNQTLQRRVTAYPLPNTHKKLMIIAERQGRSVSSIISEALQEFVNKPKPTK